VSKKIKSLKTHVGGFKMGCPKCGSKNYYQIAATAAVSDSGLLKCGDCGQVFNIIFGVKDDEKRESADGQKIRQE
jgi:transcription elongation factor Elf1